MQTCWRKYDYKQRSPNRRNLATSHITDPLLFARFLDTSAVNDGY